jgi:hypothetical protein
MRIKFYSLIAGLLFIINYSNAQVIPADRLITWQGNVGVEGGIPNRTVLIDATLPPYNAHADGLNTASEIQACLNGLSSGQVAFLPAGIYSLASTITIPSDVSLRGAGANNTILLFTVQLANDIKMGGNYTDATLGGQIDIISGYTKGSSSLLLTNASTLSPGKFIYVSELNDATIPVNVTNANGTCT